MSHFQKGPGELFDERHGKDCIQVRGGEFHGYLVYSDGAMRERSAYGALNEPPSDPLERAKVQLVYHEELLRRAVEDFDACKENLLALAAANLKQNLGSPPDHMVEQLRRLGDVVNERSKAYADAEKRVEDATPSHLKQRESENARRRQQCEDFIASVRGIKV